ncbi:MAG: oligosaccharide flippase family protein [Prevotellaceae bacterium]|nr:oligosaccharide flippase family protein [Candidatus Colivivens equi]
MGICNFVDSIINYYILFSMMGVTTLGIREIARSKNDRQKLNNTFSSIIFLNIITTLVMAIILFVTTITIPKLSDYKELLFIGEIKLIFNCFLIEWFYKGIENFKYITIRTIIVKIAYVAGVFLFIHKADDYPIYYILTTMTIVINAIINTTYCKKIVSFSWKDLNIKSFYKQYLILGIYCILTSMYTTFNVMYLGFVCNDTEVGYYTTAVKLHTLILALFTALTNVLMPRMSFLFSQNKMDDFMNLYKATIEILFIFSFPLIVYSIAYSSQIILLLAGPGYEISSVCLQIIIANILIIGMEQVLIVQILMPMSKDQAILFNSIVGAVTGVVLNVILIGQYGCVGASVSWISAEFIVCIMAMYFTYKFTKLKINFILLTRHVLCAMPICVGLLLLSSMNINYIASMFIGFLVLCMYYCIIHVYIIKSTMVLEFISKLKNIILP